MNKPRSSKKIDTYWNRRKRLHYYQTAITFAKQYVPHGGAVLDVGSHDCAYISMLDWFEVKHALDLVKTPTLPGVLSIKEDFMLFVPDRTYDLIICLQVLEHLKNPEAFCNKLLQTGKCVIISVPFKWPRGKCSRHVQDPVDEAKLLKWCGRDWTERRIVRDGNSKRLVVVFSNPS